MYVFAIALLFGLGIMALSKLAARVLNTETWALTTVVLGIALAWLANFDVWSAWGVDVRASWIGVTLSGLAIGGIGFFWHVMLDYVESLYRKHVDEAVEFERTHNIRRVA